MSDFGSFDLAFQTYVTPVPEPSAAYLLSIAAAAFVIVRSCHRQRLGRQFRH
jgi:hypothetical protein